MLYVLYLIICCKWQVHFRREFGWLWQRILDLGRQCRMESWLRWWTVQVCNCLLKCTNLEVSDSIIFKSGSWTCVCPLSCGHQSVCSDETVYSRSVGFHGIWFHVFFQELHRQLAMQWQQTHCRFWSRVTVSFVAMVHWGSMPGARRTAWRTGYWNMRD